MQVQKRNLEIVPFNSMKIRVAINKAFNEDVNDEVLNFLVVKVCQKITKDVTPIEEIQDIVETVLMKYYPQVAKKFILYRARKEEERKIKALDKTVLSLVANENEEVGLENSNKNPELLNTQRDLIAGEISKDITNRLLLPPHLAKAHKDGVIHIHDTDFFISNMTNCCLLNIKDMFENGIVINNKLIEEPKSFQVACIVLGNIISVIGGQQYGGQSVNIKHLGKYLKKSEEKIVKKFTSVRDKLSQNDIDGLVQEELQKELSNGIQTLQYQINTLYSSAGQTPFVTLFLEIDEKDEYLPYTVRVIDEIISQRIQGLKNRDGVYTTIAFPKLVYVLDHHNSLQGGKYDYITEKCVQCNIKRIMPDYISAKNMRKLYEGNVFSPMGCRSFLSPWKDKDGNYKFEGRFNFGVTSVNLVRPALIVKDNQNKIDDYFIELDKSLSLAYEMQMLRYKRLKGTKSDVAPLLWQYGGVARLQSGETIDRLLEGGYSSLSIGYVGIYEAVKVLLGVQHTEKDGEMLALKIMKYLDSKIQLFKEQTGLGWGLYGTPAESLIAKFATSDRKTFGDIPDITDKGYYTNSFHVDVREQIDAFSKLSFEAQFVPYSLGGHISYIELPYMYSNPQAVRELVKFIYENCVYAELNTKSDYCYTCQSETEMMINNGYWECPHCHNTDTSKMNVVRRSCGYLGENFWNSGRTKEISERVTHL